MTIDYNKTEKNICKQKRFKKVIHEKNEKSRRQ